MTRLLLLRAGHHPVDGRLDVGLPITSGRRRRAASRAASFIRLARSAPVKPGVRRASTSRSHVGSSGLPLACTSRIALRPSRSGAVDDDLAVEAARAAAGPGRGCRAGWWPAIRITPCRRVEAVHLDEQLVERLLPLVVAAAEAGAAVAADGVDLVDEDDGRRLRLGLLEQVADAAGADADEHLDEVGARDREERHAGLAGHGPGEQRLAGARAARRAARPSGILAPIAWNRAGFCEELLDLLQLLDGLVDAGHVGEA